MEKQKINILSAKDCDISYYRGPGNGGSARNKTSNAVQIIHRESGAIGRCSESRSQLDNKKLAFQRLVNTPKFKIWMNKKLYEIEQGQTMEEAVDREMAEENLRFEIKKDGKWVEVSEKDLLKD